MSVSPPTSSPDARKTASGCLFGLAIGDALAAPTEFIRDVASIGTQFGAGAFAGAYHGLGAWPAD